MVEIKVGNVYSYRTLVGRNGKLSYNTPKYVAYAHEIGMQINHLKPTPPPYYIVIHFELKGGKRIDLDNASKPILDILQNHGLIDNDQNIVKLHLSKTNGNKENKIRLHIESVV